MTTRVLKLMRQYHELTQLELAKSIGLSPDRIQALETGTGSASRAELKLYSEFFDVPLKSLLFLSEAVRGNASVRSRMSKFMSKKCVDLLEWLNSKKVANHAKI